MATALLWADLDRQQTNQVYSVQPWTYDTVTSLLANFLEDLDTSTPTGEILAKYYFINLRLAVESQFSAEKTSTLFSVLKLTHFTSMGKQFSASRFTVTLFHLIVYINSFESDALYFDFVWCMQIDALQQTSQCKR